MNVNRPADCFGFLSAFLNVFEPEKYAKTKDYISSIKRSFKIFDYHYGLAQTALQLPYIQDGFICKSEQDRLLQGNKTHANLFIAHQANCIAAAQTIRSMFEIFVQIVNVIYSLQIKEKKCNLIAVVSKLNSQELSSKLNNIYADRDFKYLQAFNNVSKHRFNVDRRPIRSGNECLAMKFMSFSYNEDSYEEIDSIVFLDRLIDLKNKLVGCCNIMTAELVNNFFSKEVGYE